MRKSKKQRREEKLRGGPVLRAGMKNLYINSINKYFLNVLSEKGKLTIIFETTILCKLCIPLHN